MGKKFLLDIQPNILAPLKSWWQFTSWAENILAHTHNEKRTSFRKWVTSTSVVQLIMHFQVWKTYSPVC
jgi:hypothetical protein